MATTGSSSLQTSACWSCRCAGPAGLFKFQDHVLAAA
jgi:hypothetical protein